MNLIEQLTVYARATYPAGDLPHIFEVVAYAQSLARKTGADEEIVAIAAYFHDISRATMGAKDHNFHSAEMARQWLSQVGYPVQRIEQVAAAIVAHMLPVTGLERELLPLESRILYDADKIGRAQGLGLVGALVRLGQEIPWEELSYTELATVLRKGRAATEEAYRSLYTEAAQELAGPGYQKAVDFCDSLLQAEVFRTVAAE
ncbi:MAG: HD domain-containing protein [Chloroflexi bacterium]|nr:HD domain-containing protein [Chloroflexota bacterium]